MVCYELIYYKSLIKKILTIIKLKYNKIKKLNILY